MTLVRPTRCTSIEVAGGAPPQVRADGLPTTRAAGPGPAAGADRIPDQHQLAVAGRTGPGRFLDAIERQARDPPDRRGGPARWWYSVTGVRHDRPHTLSPARKGDRGHRDHRRPGPRRYGRVAAGSPAADPQGTAIAITGGTAATHAFRERRGFTQVALAMSISAGSASPDKRSGSATEAIPGLGGS
jgi:hypothetical protein